METSIGLPHQKQPHAKNPETLSLLTTPHNVLFTNNGTPKHSLS
uniref:Uncharacterized protein n=1 Tax=Anguilla anguilla TaxID=7936 RepID=A0A0E9UQE3_ANGAN